MPQLLATLARAADAAAGRRLVFFLDYDGTLSPIVSDPDAALLPPRTRAALTALAAVHTTAVVSGRSLEKVRALVDVPGIIYAGSHGFDIAGPAGSVPARCVGEEWRPRLEAAASDLEREVLPVYAGTAVEDNKLSMSLHYRNAVLVAEDDALSTASASTRDDGSESPSSSSSGSVSPAAAGEVAPGSLRALEAAVDAIVARHGLRRTRGKCVLELRPRLDWHKGKAVTYLLEALDLLAPDVLPLYIGDDVTDEDAFRALRARGGLGVRVASADDCQPTCAQLRLEDTAEVCKFLEHFAGAAVAGLGVAPAAAVPAAVSASR